MKKRLAIAAGIFSFLAALAVLGFLRLGQRQETGRAPMATAPEPIVHADAKTTTASPTAEKQEELERAELEKARKENELLMARREAEKQASATQAASKQPPGAGAAPPPVLKPMPRTVPSSPSSASSPDLSILDRKSGGGVTAPSPSSSAAGGTSLEEVDAALKKLDWGQMAFDVPEKLRLEQTALIHLLISPAQTAEQLTAAIREQTSEPVKIESARIQISGMMEAKLVGSAFDIRSITPEEPQMVSRTEPTEWKWEIRPLQSGRQSLHLTLNAIVRFEEKERPRVVRTFDRIIEVDVGAPVSVTSPRAPWLLPAAVLAAAVLALGVATAFYRMRRRRVSRTGPAPSIINTGEPVDLFISYSRKDEARVLPIVERLRASGMTVWMDQGGIEGATLWAQEITHAIRRAKVCLLFGSAASFESSHVTREVSLACEEHKPILPLQLEPVETPSAMRYHLAGIQHIVLYQGDPDANFQLILRALTRLGLGAAAPLG